MHPKEFHEKIDQARLLTALAEVEHKTTGRVYVYVSHRPIADALAQAHRRFAKLGLHRLHEHRNAVLIYLAPRTHKFAIVGDKAIHERCGEVFWKQLADQLSRDLKAGDVTAALLNAIGTLEATLVEHFPAGAAD
jgi:uncharacterized membrane protein